MALCSDQRGFRSEGTLEKIPYKGNLESKRKVRLHLGFKLEK